MIMLREVFVEVVLWWKVGFDRSTHMTINVRREPVRILDSKVAQGLNWRFHATAVGIHNDLRRCQLIPRLAIESAECASCRDETVRGVLTAFEGCLVFFSRTSTGC